MNDLLLPCPFCGGKACRLDFAEPADENYGGAVIACQDCDACSRVVFGEKEGLVDSWNKRVKKSAKSDPVNLLEEIDEYLSRHEDDAIFSGSRLHREIKDILSSSKQR